LSSIFSVNGYDLNHTNIQKAGMGAERSFIALPYTSTKILNSYIRVALKEE
jgi:hypothetical protein